jgi:hypothetical protein
MPILTHDKKSLAINFPNKSGHLFLLKEDRIQGKSTQQENRKVRDGRNYCRIANLKEFSTAASYVD